MENNEKECHYQKVPTKEPIKDGGKTKNVSNRKNLTSALKARAINMRPEAFFMITLEVPDIPTSYGYGVRHVQAALLLLNLTVAYTARAHLSLTVVAMSRPEADMTTNNTHSFYNESINLNATVDSNISNVKRNAMESEINETLSKLDQENETADNIWNVYRTYDWDKSIQEMILDAFFLGYFLMMFPMGMICQRFGGKIPLQICLLVNGLLSIVTPTIAVWGGWKAVCCCRVLHGLSQAGVYPSTHTLLSKWVPISERAMFSSYIYTGSTIGTVIAFQLSGALASSEAGWPATFWVFGCISILAFILVTMFAAASPIDHKTISEEEKRFILGRMDDGIEKSTKVPWKKILSSKHVWGAFATHIASGISFVFLFTQIPTYMYYILGFNIKDSGILSSLPYIANIFLSIVYGYASDYCTNRGIFSLKAGRIISNSVAQVGPALCLVAVSFTDNCTFAVILLIFGVGLISGVHTGWMVNYIDLSPNFSGPLMAFGNTLTNFGALAQPLLISNIITNVKNRFQWRIMMFLMASIMFISNAIFGWLMSSDLQPWDQVDTKGTSDPEESKEFKKK